MSKSKSFTITLPKPAKRNSVARDMQENHIGFNAGGPMRDKREKRKNNPKRREYDYEE